MSDLQLVNGESQTIQVLPAIRDGAGKFVPGLSGNPGGRPKSRRVSEELNARLEAGAAEEIGSQLIEMATDKKDKWLALAATKEVIDRTEGKAMQQVKMEAQVDDKTAQRVLDMYERLAQLK